MVTLIQPRIPLPTSINSHQSSLIVISAQRNKTRSEKFTLNPGKDDPFLESKGHNIKLVSKINLTIHKAKMVKEKPAIRFLANQQKPFDFRFGLFLMCFHEIRFPFMAWTTRLRDVRRSDQQYATSSDRAKKLLTIISFRHIENR